MAEVSSDSWLDYCIQSARAYHYDLYLASLRAKTLPLPHAMVLLALHHEIDKIPYVTTEVTLAMIRLQWWQDALSECFRHANDPAAPPPRSHPITKGLTDYFSGMDEALREERYGLIQRYLEAETVRATEPLHHFEQFGEQQATRYGLLYSLLSENKEAEQSERLIGECSGYLREILALPQQLVANQITLPADILRKHKVNPDRYGSDSFKQTCQHMVQEIGAKCDQLLNSLPNDLKQKNRYLHIRNIQLRSVLKRLRKADYNILEQDIRLTTPWSALALWLRG